MTGDNAFVSLNIWILRHLILTAALDINDMRNYRKHNFMHTITVQICFVVCCLEKSKETEVFSISGHHIYVGMTST